MIFVVTGAARAGGTELSPGSLLLYLGGRGGRVQPLGAAAGSTLLLLGGEPLGEPLLMWWNFVARTPEEIVTAARDWTQSTPVRPGARVSRAAAARPAGRPDVPAPALSPHAPARTGGEKPRHG